MALHANYTKERAEFKGESVILLDDQGPWNLHLTITNDIDNVLAELNRLNILEKHPVVLYLDSGDDLTGVRYEVVDGEVHFVNFYAANETFLVRSK